VSFLISGFLGIRHYKEDNNKFNVIDYKKEYVYGIIFIAAGYVAEYVYTRGMPFTNPDILYLDYKGIPTLHVILYTFTIFYSVFLFYLFICNKKRRLIMLFIISLIPSVLLISRGMMVNIFIGCFFVSLQNILQNKVLSKKVMLSTCGVVLSVFFVFGMFGNYRSNKNVESVTNKFSSDYILSVGGASEGFKGSFIPKPFFWAYLYISSPLANLQKNVSEYAPELNADNLRKFVTVEIVPDFIAKRISSTYEKDIYKRVELIKPELVVGTMYMGSYYFLGWAGIILIYLYMTIFSYLYLKLLKKNKIYYVVGVASLCNIIALNTFSNMMSFSGMLFQLVYPLILPYIGPFIGKFKGIKLKSAARYISKKVRIVK